MAPNHRPGPSRAAALRVLLIVVTATIGLAVPGIAHADQIRDKQWHLNFLDIAKAHETTRGEGVIVAVLDTGVDYKHPDLKGALLEGRTYAGGRSDGWEDAQGHGTAMASLVAARGHGQDSSDGVLGLAPAAKVLPVRTNSGGYGDSRALEQGIEWAVDHGADVLSISQGYVDNPDIQEAVNYALEKDVVIVASSGTTETGDEEVVAPALYPGVVAVSSTDQDGEFSDASVPGPQVVLSAPGVDIMAAIRKSGYATGTGSSPSAAIVAGVAALIKSKYPDLDAANIIQRLIATAVDRGPDGRDSQYGFGIVDPVAALTVDVPEVDSNPLVAPSKASATPSTSATAAPDNAGIGPAGYGLIALGFVGAAILAVTGLAAMRRRRGRWRPLP